MKSRHPAKLGQNFLVNRSLAEKIARSFLPVEGDILEIGPGRGILTEILIREARENKITVIDIDPDMCRGLFHLKERHPQFAIIQGSILDLDLSSVAPGLPINLIGNLPYYLSKEIIDWVIASEKQIKTGLFMMQKEFVDKLPAGPEGGKTSAQSVMFAFLFQTARLITVNPGSFSPRPKVKSTVFSFKKQPQTARVGIDPAAFYSFLQAAFAGRRKTLVNNLRACYPDENWPDIFPHLGIDGRARAEALTPDRFPALFGHLSRLPGRAGS